MKLIAHPATKKNIERFIAKPSHGLLVIGSPDTGKGHVAKYIVVKLLDTQADKLANYPYLKLLNNLPNQDAGIDDIRDIKKFLRLKTTGYGNLRRFVIIRNAEQLGHEAQNAMLKLLEEPPDDTCIILTTAEPTKLKPTIISRLQTIRVQHLSKSQINELATDKSQTDKLYALSEGAASLFLSLDKAGSHTNSRYIEDAKKIIAGHRTDRLIAVDKITKDDEYDIAMLLDGLYKIINMKFKIVSDTKTLSVLHKKMHQILDAQKKLSQNVQPKLVLNKLFYEL